MSGGKDHEYWKIIFKGKTPGDIHGVTFRESVQRVCLMQKFNICGQIRNIKNTDKVEAIFQLERETKKDVGIIIKNIIRFIEEKNELFEKKDLDSIRFEKIDDFSVAETPFTTFEVVREDELTEMMWSLQNAGKAFLLQLKMKEVAQVRALEFELEANKELLAKIDDDDNVYNECFNYLAVENILREPSMKWKRNFIIKLHHLCAYYKVLNHMIETERKKEDMPLDEIRKMLEEISTPKQK